MIEVIYGYVTTKVLSNRWKKRLSSLLQMIIIDLTWLELENRENNVDRVVTAIETVEEVKIDSFLYKR